MNVYKVMLLTSKGEFVKESTLPAFIAQPDILFWGNRTFVFKKLDMQSGELTYFEAFAYAVF